MNRKSYTTKRKMQPFITFLKFLPCAVAAIVAGIAAGASLAVLAHHPGFAKQ